MAKDPEKTNGVMRALSVLLDRISMFQRAGLQAGGTRDLYKTFGYEKTPQFADYATKYLRQDIARQIIRAPVESTWSPKPIVTGSKVRFNKQWEKLVKEQNVWKYLERADKLARLGRYAVLLVGFEGNSRLDLPISRGNGGSVIYLQPYLEPNAQIHQWETDPGNPRFGLPRSYQLHTASETGMEAIQSPQATRQRTDVPGETAHHSRLIHIAEDALENDVFGVPALLPILNLLDDLLKVVGGSAETYWLISNRGMHADVDKEMELDDEDAAALSEELEEYANQLRRIVRTRGVKLNNMGSESPNPGPVFDAIISLLSGSTGFPKRILFGSEAGELASSEDKVQWAGRIMQRRESHAWPNILHPFIMRCVEGGALPDPGELTYEWPAPVQLTPLEQAQMMAQKARAVVNIAKHYKEGPLVSVTEAREILQFSGPLDVNDLPKTPEPKDNPNDPGNSNGGGEEEEEEEEEGGNGAPSNRGGNDDE